MGHSQQIYHKNLLGTWDLTDTTHGKMAFQFIDSTHSIILTERPQIIVKSIGTYKLDQKDNIVELIITGDTSIISKKQKSDTTFSKNTSRFLMKLVDLNIFKLQIDMSNTGQWAPEEQNNTGTYIKRKIVY
jgi:hypothetical protein